MDGDVAGLGRSPTVVPDDPRAGQARAAAGEASCGPARAGLSRGFGVLPYAARRYHGNRSFFSVAKDGRQRYNLQCWPFRRPYYLVK